MVLVHSRMYPFYLFYAQSVNLEHACVYLHSINYVWNIGDTFYYMHYDIKITALLTQ